MGALLLTASAGLVVKLLMVRSAGSAESFKQLADLATANGVNRMIALLNTNDVNFLWNLNQDDSINTVGTPLRQWNLLLSGNETDLLALRAQMEQPCVPLPIITAADRESIKKTIKGGELSNNLRADDRPGGVAISYRLRSYAYLPGESKGFLTVEGYATQGSGNTKTVLARSLLTRGLALKRSMPSNDDWGVIAGKTMDLGQSSITGDGKVLWLLDANGASRFGTAGSCTPASLGAALGSTNTTTQSKLIPLQGSDFPDPNMFNEPTSTALDYVPSSKTLRRVWNIDDNRTNNLCGPLTGQRGPAICIRDEDDKNPDTPPPTWARFEPAGTVKQDGAGKITNITIHAENICVAEDNTSTKPCVLYIDGIQLKDGATLSIETARNNGARPVVLRMFERSTININRGTLCQAGFNGSTTDTLGCNNSAKAENLAIVASNGDNSTNCNANGATQNLKFGGGSLPAALVLMPQGTVTIINTAATLSGLLWAGNICAANGITVSSTNLDTTSKVIAGFKALWDSKNTLTYGRTNTRASRGGGLDFFRRW
jgi:hypothetical protein